jgi:hypothetical protein
MCFAQEMQRSYKKAFANRSSRTKYTVIKLFQTYKQLYCNDLCVLFIAGIKLVLKICVMEDWVRREGQGKLMCDIRSESNQNKQDATMKRECSMNNGQHIR